MVLLPGPLEKYYFPKQNLPDWKLGTILMRFLFFSIQGTEFLLKLEEVLLRNHYIILIIIDPLPTDTTHYAQSLSRIFNYMTAIALWCQEVSCHHHDLKEHGQI